MTPQSRRYGHAEQHRRSLMPLRRLPYPFHVQRIEGLLASVCVGLGFAASAVALVLALGVVS